MGSHCARVLMAYIHITIHYYMTKKTCLNSAFLYLSSFSSYVPLPVLTRNVSSVETSLNQFN